MPVDKIKTSPQSPPPTGERGANDAGVTATNASRKQTNKQTNKPGPAESTKGKTMATSKRTRKYSQDFSGNSLTDQSFTPSCDVNNIVAHYDKTGIDEHAARKNQESFADATTQTFDEAMRNHAETKSAIAERGNDPANWPNLIHEPEPEITAPEPSQDAPIDPPPEDTSGGQKVD